MQGRKRKYAICCGNTAILSVAHSSSPLCTNMAVFRRRHLFKNPHMFRRQGLDLLNQPLEIRNQFLGTAFRLPINLHQFLRAPCAYSGNHFCPISMEILVFAAKAFPQACNPWVYGVEGIIKVPQAAFGAVCLQYPDRKSVV